MKTIIGFFVLFTLMMACCAQDTPEKQPGAPTGQPPFPSSPSTTSSELGTASIDWQKQVIYFVLLDRFSNGNTQNDWHPTEEDQNFPYHRLFTFCGGDAQGLIQKLPYLKQLGVTTIWISPVFDNHDFRFFDRWAYHGYWIWNFTRAEDHFTDYHKSQASPMPQNSLDQTKQLYGDIETLQQLSQAIHEQGMYLMFDMVVNHMDYNAPMLKGKTEDGAHPEWFHNNPDIANWADPYQVTNFRVHGLPDLAQEKPEVADYLIKVSQLWINALQPDAFRLDAVKHVPIEFWAKYNQAIREFASPQKDFFMLGEYYDGYGRNCAEIQRQGKFSSMIDFPLHFQILEVIGKEHSAMNFGQLFNHDRSYDNPNLLATFLDNHDTDRFMTAVQGDIAKFKLGLTFLFAVRGIPTLYYGTEIGMSGQQEAYHPEFAKNRAPENRGEMDFDPQDPQAQHVRAYTQQLIQTRRHSQALTQGLQIHLTQTHNLYAFARVAPEQVALVVLNNGHQSSTTSVPLHLLANSLSCGDVADALGQGATGKIENGQLVAQIPAKTCAIFFVSGDFAKDFSFYTAWHKNPGTIPVTFTVTLPQPAHNNIAVIGESALLGNWNSRHAYLQNRMSLVGPNTYSATLHIPRGTIISFKHVQNCPEQDDKDAWQKQHGGEDWELGMDNRYLEVPWEGTCEVKSIWNKKN